MSNAEHTTSLASPVPTPAHLSQGAGSTNDNQHHRACNPQRPYRSHRRRLAGDGGPCPGACLGCLRRRRRACRYRFGHARVRARLGDAGRPVGSCRPHRPALQRGDVSELQPGHPGRRVSGPHRHTPQGLAPATPHRGRPRTTGTSGTPDSGIPDASSPRRFPWPTGPTHGRTASALTLRPGLTSLPDQQPVTSMPETETAFPARDPSSAAPSWASSRRSHRSAFGGWRPRLSTRSG